MSEAEWKAMTPEQQAEINRKCIYSPAYFYNNFWRPKDKPKLTDEQFLKLRDWSEPTNHQREYPLQN